MLDRERGAGMSAGVIRQEITASHTPGPWSCAQVWRGPETKVHAEFEGRRVALAELFTMHGTGEKEANAHLIAAAPDLLAAARRIAARAHAGVTMPSDYIALEAAIAKAVGK